jgi:hypothetical protein
MPMARQSIMHYHRAAISQRAEILRGIKAERRRVRQGADKTASRARPVAA